MPRTPRGKALARAASGRVPACEDAALEADIARAKAEMEHVSAEAVKLVAKQAEAERAAEERIAAEEAREVQEATAAKAAGERLAAEQERSIQAEAKQAEADQATERLATEQERNIEAEQAAAAAEAFAKAAAVLSTARDSAAANCPRGTRETRRAGRDTCGDRAEGP